MIDHTLSQTATRDSIAAARRLADAQLSVRSRVGHVALLLVAMIMTVVIGSLWLTEPSLPLRTRLAFAVLVTIGMLWTAYAVWVLGNRQVLFARHRIIAGWMAVSFTGIFLLGAFAAALQTGASAAYAASATGIAMLTGAIVILMRAQRAVAKLSARRAALERERSSR